MWHIERFYLTETEEEQPLQQISSHRNEGATTLTTSHFLEGPHAEVKVLHVAAAPALVRVRVGRVIALTRVGDLHSDKGGE